MTNTYTPECYDGLHSACAHDNCCACPCHAPGYPDAEEEWLFDDEDDDR